jgi:hypothetical protein
MSISEWVALGFALIATGCWCRFRAAVVTSRSLLQRVQAHGRYAGLSTTEQRENSERKLKVVVSDLRNKPVDAV